MKTSPATPLGSAGLALVLAGPKTTRSSAQAAIREVGSDYKVDLRTAKTYSDVKGRTVSGVDEGSTVSLDTPFVAGDTVGLNVRTSTSTYVSVHVSGRFRAN